MSKRTSAGLEDIVGAQIVFDTSVLISLRDKGYRPALLSHLKKLETLKNEFFASTISLYELNKNVESQQQILDNAKLLQRVTPLALTQQRLLGAGIVHGVMLKYIEGFRNKQKTISCDLLIAGTVIQNPEALLMTTNISDFPMPLWNVRAECRGIKKNSGVGWSVQNWYIIGFDHSKLPEEFRRG